MVDFPISYVNVDQRVSENQTPEPPENPGEM